MRIIFVSWLLDSWSFVPLSICPSIALSMLSHTRDILMSNRAIMSLYGHLHAHHSNTTCEQEYVKKLLFTKNCLLPCLMTFKIFSGLHLSGVSGNKHFQRKPWDPPEFLGKPLSHFSRKVQNHLTCSLIRILHWTHQAGEYGLNLFSDLITYGYHTMPLKCWLYLLEHARKVPKRRINRTLIVLKNMNDIIFLLKWV